MTTLLTPPSTRTDLGGIDDWTLEPNDWYACEVNKNTYRIAKAVVRKPSAILEHSQGLIHQVAQISKITGGPEIHIEANYDKNAHPEPVEIKHLESPVYAFNDLLQIYVINAKASEAGLDKRYMDSAAALARQLIVSFGLKFIPEIEKRLQENNTLEAKIE